MNKKYETPSMAVIISDSVYTNDLIVNSNGGGGETNFEELWGEKTNATGLEF